jgi:hypothetical protein
MDALYLLLGKNRIDASIELPLFREKDEPGECFKAVKTVILCLVEEINDPAAPFDPVHKAKDSCLYCDYRYLCGTT